MSEEQHIPEHCKNCSNLILGYSKDDLLVTVSCNRLGDDCPNDIEECPIVENLIDSASEYCDRIYCLDCQGNDCERSYDIRFDPETNIVYVNCCLSESILFYEFLS